MSCIKNTCVFPVIRRSPHSLVYRATLRDYILCFWFSQSISQSQILKKGISCHSSINIQIFVMKNYLGTPKFKTIDHSKHKLDFYNWSYFGYCQSKCTFSDHSWLFFFFFFFSWLLKIEKATGTATGDLGETDVPQTTPSGELPAGIWLGTGVQTWGCAFPLVSLFLSSHSSDLLRKFVLKVLDWLWGYIQIHWIFELIIFSLSLYRYILGRISQYTEYFILMKQLENQCKELFNINIIHYQKCCGNSEKKTLIGIT